MNVSRRQLIVVGTSAIPLSVLLAGCGNGASTSPPQIATDANLIATGLSSAIIAVEAIPGVPAATITQLQGYLATIQKDATDLATTLTPGTSAQEIATDVQAVAAIAAPFIPGGSALLGVFDAAVSLVPAILSSAGISGSVKMATSKMTPEQARLVLAGAAKK